MEEIFLNTTIPGFKGQEDDLIKQGYLEKKGQITTIITNDSDLLILGSSTVLRPISPLRGAVFDKRHICDILGFTAQQWDDFMYLCKNMKDKDVLLAYSLISVYKELEYVHQKYYLMYQEYLTAE